MLYNKNWLKLTSVFHLALCSLSGVANPSSDAFIEPTLLKKNISKVATQNVDPSTAPNKPTPACPPTDAIMTTPFGNVFQPSEKAQSGVCPPCSYEEVSSTQQVQIQIAEPIQTSENSKVLTGIEPTPVHCPPDVENDGYVINFSNINFEEYLHFLSKLTDTNFVYDPQDVQFTVSVMADAPTNIKEIRTALLQILRVRGLTLVEEGNNVIISQDADFKGMATVISDEMGNLCDTSDPLVTRVFYLNNANPTKVAAIVSSMVSPGAIVEPSEDTHHLIVTDLTSNVTAVGDLLKSLDNPEAAFEIGTYRSQKTYVENLVTLAEKILFPIAEGNPLVMVPQQKSSTVFVVSSPYLVRKTLEVLQALDLGDGSPHDQDQAPDGHMTNAEFFIYKLQYHKGSQIQETLKEVAQDLSQMGNVNSQLLTTINSAQWIESNNSLLFIGNPTSINKIKELLKIIDAPLRQVFIEVLAVRTSIGNSLELGVQYGYRAKASERMSTVGSLFTTPNPTVGGTAIKPTLFTQGLDAITGQSIPVPQTPNQLGLAAGVIGNVLFKGANLYFDLAGLVDALQTDNKTEVVTNPKLVTQDTIPATFYVGSTRPFQTNSILQASGSSTGNFVTASIEYRQLGLSLTVTPYLGSSDIITMEIQQSTSDYVNNAVSSNSGNSDNFAIVPVTNDSSITTRVHVPDKHFLMISGMLEDIKTKSKSAIPCLGGLPFIGDLLGTRANSVSKDNFIIFLRPQIIDTVEDLDTITTREGDLYQEKSRSGSFIKNSSKLYFMNK